MTTEQLIRPEGTVGYSDTGAPGPLVVAMPGIGDLRGTYRHLVPLLRAKGFRVVTMDMRGFGESTATWSDMSARALGGDLVALIRALDCGPAVLIGNSYSAGAVVWAACEAPDLVSARVLVGPFVRPLPVSFWMRLALAVLFGGPWARRAWQLYWNTLFPTRKPADHAEYRALLGRNLAEPGRMAALKKLLTYTREDTGAILGDSRVPTLVVMGTKDPDFADPGLEARTVAGLTHGETAMIEGAGHYPHAEMPDETADAITRFVGAGTVISRAA